MKIAVFQQLYPVADSEGFVRCLFAVDTNGNIWLRSKKDGGLALGWDDWEPFDMPEQEPPKDAWDALLDAQERLRAEGREVLVNDVTQFQGLPEEGEMQPRPLRPDEITGGIDDVRVRTQTYHDGEWVDDYLQ